MSDNDVYLPSASSTESFDTSFSSSKEEMEVASPIQPYEGEPLTSNEDFDEDWLRRFLACGVQVKIRTKNSRFLMFSLFRLCFVFYGEIYVLKEWVAVFVFVDITFYSFSLIPLAHHKLTFDERIGCITRHDDFVPRSHRAVSLQVASFLKDCKGWGCRRRACQTENERIYLIQVNLE